MIERLCLQDLLLTDTSHGGMKFKIEKEYPILHVRRIVFQSNQPPSPFKDFFPSSLKSSLVECDIVRSKYLLPV